MALSAALHHSRGVWPELHEAHGDRRRTGQWRRRSASCTTPLRDRSDLLRGCGRHLWPEVAGPQAAVTVGYVAAVAPSLAVVSVSDMRHDDATVQFLQQSLLARAEEEEKAREEAEVKVMEEKVDRMMEQLAEKVLEVARREGFRLSLDLSSLERTACAFVAHSEGLRKKKEKRKRRRRRIRSVWVSGQLLFITPLPLFL